MNEIYKHENYEVSKENKPPIDRDRKKMRKEKFHRDFVCYSGESVGNLLPFRKRIIL